MPVFIFEQEPNVEITYDEKKTIISIIGDRNDGTEINNTTVRNPRRSKIEITLPVSDKYIVGKLRAHPFFFKNIPQPTQPVERFKRVVNIFVEIATTSGSWGEPFTGDAVWSQNDLSEYNNIVKFLFVADQVGFYDLKQRERKERKSPETKDVTLKKQSSEIEEFRKNEFVGTWLGKIWRPSDPTADDGYVTQEKKFKDKPEDAKSLWQALILLDMTPDEFIAGTKDKQKAEEIQNKPEQKIVLLTKRLHEKTFSAIPNSLEAKAFPNPISLLDWANMPFIPIKTEMEDTNPNSKSFGKMIKVTFAKQRSSVFDPADQGVKKKLTKMMRHFAESNGITGTWTQVWSQKTVGAKKGSLDLDIHYLKEFEQCLKNQVEFDKNGEFIMYEENIRGEKTNDKIAGQTRILEYAKGKTKRYVKGDKIPIKLADGTIIPPDEPYFPVEKIVTTKEDWDSAFMYYKVAMDLGWRAEEAFTSGANKSASDKESGTEIKKIPDKKDKDGKIIEKGKEFILLRIMTRKTAHVGISHHGGSIINEKTQELIRKKRAHVEEYSDTKKYTYDQAKAKGVIQSYISRAVDPTKLKWNEQTKEFDGLPPEYGKSITNKIHALVGADGYFTEVGTMDLPAHDMLTKIERKKYRDNKWQLPKVKKIDRNRDKLKAIMRHCYEQVLVGDLYDNYFRYHSLHALRHLFAQYWLKASAIENGGVKDFAMVMKMGHWGGIDVLMNFYGESSNIEITKRAMKIGKTYEQLELGEKILKEQEKEDQDLNKELDEVEDESVEEPESQPTEEESN